MGDAAVKRKSRLYAVLFLLVGLLLVFSTSYGSFLINERFRAAMDNQLEERMEQVRINILRKNDADLQTLHTLASFVQFSRDMDMDAFVQGLYQSSAQTHFVRMAYFSLDGNGVQVSLEGVVEQSLSQSQLHPLVQAMISSAWQGADTLSEVYYDLELQQHMVAYAIPVYSDGVRIGALAASQYASLYSDIIRNTGSVSPQGVAAVVNGQGDLLMGVGYPNKAGLTHLEDLEQLPEDEVDSLHSLLEQNQVQAFRFKGPDGVRYHGVTALLGIYDYKVLLLESEEQINGLLSGNILVTRTVSMAITFLAILGLFLGFRHLMRNNQKLMRLAYYDAVTGAYNLEKFNQLLQDTLHCHHSCTLVALNIRHFKFINEIFGPTQSNRLLCYIKEVLEAQRKPGEYFCRQSADQFFLLLLTNRKEEVSQRLEALFVALQEMTERRHSGYPIRFYCGAATSDSVSGDNPGGTLMVHTMFALSRARRGQQNYIQFYNQEIHKSEQLRNYIESHMQQALEREEFHLYLQPKIDLEQNQISGAEALVRWVTEDGTVLYPDEFIPLFEDNGFCTQLDLYMVEQVCRQLREWLDRGLEPVPISVNQTKLLFYQNDYVQTMGELTQRYQVPPDLITLEILEGIALENVESLNACIDQLKRLGFRISMDDFGCGYSSLNTLGKLHIDELKLDREFLLASAQTQDNQRQRLILEQIIELAKKMRIHTVAEGVERQSDAAMLTRMGCECGQGYYYSKPLPADQFQTRYLSQEPIPSDLDV